MTRVSALVAALIAASALACTTTPMQLGPIPDVQYDAGRGKEVASSACGFQLLNVIPIMTGSREERAYQRLVEAAPFDYVTDISVVVYWRWAFVGNLYCTMLKGTAYPKQ